MTMQEMVKEIVETIELQKQVGLCIQYISPLGKVVARNLKMLEIQQGSADNITQAILHYISVSQLAVQKMAGGASDGASVMMGHINGVMMQLKGVLPLFIATHYATHHLTCCITSL